MTTTNDNGLQGYTLSFNGTVIPQVESISGPDLEQEFYTVSYIGDQFERMSPTLIKAAKITVTCGYDPSAHSFLFTAMTATPVTKGAIVLVAGASPDASVPAQTFSYATGYVASYKVVGGSAKDQSKLEVVLQTSGPCTVS